MKILIDDVLTNAIAVLQDAGAARCMPSGTALDDQTTGFMLDCVFELETLRETLRSLTAGGIDNKEETLIALARCGLWNGSGSTSEVITVALAMDRLSALPAPYGDVESAWARLNLRQQGIVRHHNQQLALPV